MRKLIKYDLKHGWNNTYYKFGIFAVIIIIINIIGVNSIKMIVEDYGTTADILDYICFVVGGPKYIPEGMVNRYIIPVLWLLIQVGISYTIGYYAVADLHTYGQQILLRSPSRARWWISKVVWNFVTVCGLYIILYGITLLSGALAGCEWKWKLTPQIATNLCNIDAVLGSRYEHMIILLIMPVITSIALSMVQMAIALLSSPMIGFIVAQSVVILSTIYAKKWLISNYAMLSHNKLTCPSEIIFKEGIIINVLVCVVSISVGVCYFRKCDIILKREEV